MSAPANHVVLREVGLRDGLQGSGTSLPTALKCDWILLGYAAGLRDIEVGSYSRSGKSPALQDTAELVAFAGTLPDLVVSVQVADVEGARRALAGGARRLGVPLSVSDVHSRANVGRGTADMLSELQRICALRDAERPGVAVEADLATAFSCARLGPTAPQDTARVAVAACSAGADACGIGDTFATATPEAVARCVEAIARDVPVERLSAHLHEAPGGGLPNVRAALTAGVRRFDATLAGIGGSTLRPGAPGNVSIEDVAGLLQDLGFDTGVEMPTLLELLNFVGRHPDAATLNAAIRRAAEKTRAAYAGSTHD